jgi:hypothetical protein
MAGAKLEIDETKWISIGIGTRVSFTSIENPAPDTGRLEDLYLDSARIYLNGQVHEYLKFEINTECVFCNNTALRDFEILDAVAKFEFSSMFNIWAGRVLVPADRAEASGPYYANTYDFNKTPLYPTDFSIRFGTGGAGVYNRDHGATLWGAVYESRLQYAFGVYDGLESSSTSGPNHDDSPLFATRIAYNFLNVEKNPGYYGSSTYFGKAGDIFTVGFAAQLHDNGVGTITNPGDFFGMSVDMLFEKVLSNNAVFTVEAEYKNFDSDFNTAGYTDGGACFCMFDGDAWTATALYLFPQKIVWGQFQPYVRYTENNPNASADRDEFEAGLNYIIDGHNARIAAFYQTGDIATKGLNYAPTATGENVDAFKVGLQLQF